MSMSTVSPAHDPSPQGRSSRHPRLRVSLPLLVAAGSFALSVGLIHRHPVMYWYDPFGRVVSRAHILVDRWLPLLQLVIYAVGKLTISVTALRLVLAALAAGTLFAASTLGTRLSTCSGGLLFAALLASNSLFVALAIVPYQEVLFLGLIFAGLSLQERPTSRYRRWLAAFAFNLACLTRYEAWILVAILAGAEVVESVGSNGFGRGLRAAAGLAIRYGAAAIGWLILVRVLAPETTLFRQGAPTERIADFLHQIRWQVGSVLLFPLAGLGLTASLARDRRRRSHLIVLTFLIGDLALIRFANPFSPGNLRSTFMPVVLVLLYSAIGMDLIIDQVLLRVRLPARGRAKLILTSVVAAFIAIAFVRDATRFVGSAANEFDFRVPFEVARRLQGVPKRLQGRARIVTLDDNYTDRLVISAYTGIPIDRIVPFDGDLPPDACQIVDIRRPGAILSSAAQNVSTRLEDGLVPATAVRIESAVIWTLETPERCDD
jgi:hypothetical protein